MFVGICVCLSGAVFCFVLVRNAMHPSAVSHAGCDTDA